MRGNCLIFLFKIFIVFFFFSQENTILLQLEDQTELTNLLARKHFPRRRYDQVYSHFHFLRMNRSSPLEYIKELRVSL